MYTEYCGMARLALPPTVLAGPQGMHRGPELVHKFWEGVQVEGRVRLQGYGWRLWVRSAERAGGQKASTGGQGCHVLRAPCNCVPEQQESGEGA